MKKQILQPNPVDKVFCPKCKELMVKIYPWSAWQIPDGPERKNRLCKKCQNKMVQA